MTGCEKMILGPDASNDPENIFELLWNDFDQHYALFGVRGSNWDSIYQDYRPQVTESTSDEELWSYFANMIEYLDDGHTLIYNPDTGIAHVSGDSLAAVAENEFKLSLVEEKFLESLTAVESDEEVFYGKVADKPIGYLYMGDMEGDDPAVIDEIMSDLSQYEALILDLRLNGGGDDLYAERIAGAFADGEHFIYTVQNRNGPGHDDFEEKRPYYTIPAGDNQYLKPVVILTDRYTVSAAEVFLLHMNAFAHVTQIGDTTAGDFSDGSMLRFLPNGWLYRFSIQRFLLPDGKSLDGLGHVPDIYIKNTEGDMQAEEDLVMDRALQFLKEEHGIE